MKTILEGKWDYIFDDHDEAFYTFTDNKWRFDDKDFLQEGTFEIKGEEVEFSQGENVWTSTFKLEKDLLTMGSPRCQYRKV